MKTVPPERWRQIESLLDAVLDLPADQRAPYLSTHCPDDPTLRAAVERLVLACEQPTIAALHPPEPSAIRIAVEGVTPALDRIGPYRILSTLGEGGMGIVYRAERDDAQFTRRVAIKVLRHGAGRPELVERFRQERQVLAGLDHPGIARLLDGGITANGLPYLVMEEVDGLPLDVHCAQHGLTLAPRLRLLESVLAAVQYAHEHLVVHRDLKPANILVTREGQVKLLDFGIAKLLDPSPRGHAALTDTGMRLMTPEYAAPEQVRGEPITAATDVHAMGVVMYELLVGQRPYALTGRSLSEVERIICETVPARPSSAAIRADELPTGVASRNLRGDLDTIVLKALHKEPNRRYPTAAAMLEDLVRHRHGHPVRARPDSLGYRGGKFVRRHALGVAIAAGLVAVVVTAAVRERTLRHSAEAEARRANAATAFLTGVFDAADPFSNSPPPSDSLTARALLDRGAARLETTLASDPALRARMRTVLGRIYGRLGDHEPAATLLEAAVRERRSLPNASVDLAESLTELGAVLINQSRLPAADTVLTEAIALWRALPGDQRAGLARALDRHATALQERNRYDEAAPIFEEVLALRLAVGGPHDLDAAESYNNLGLIRWFAGDYAGAERLYRKTATIRAARLGERHPATAAVLHNIAQAKQLQGQLDSAEALFRTSLAMKRDALGNAHPDVTVHLNNLGRLLRERGRPAEAEPLVREALVLDRTLFGTTHPYVAASLDNLAGVLLDLGQFEAAEAALREARRINVATLGEEHTAVALNENGIGTTHLRRGQLAEAETMYRTAGARYHRIVGPDHRNTITVTGNLAAALRERGALVEAESLGQWVVGQLERELPAAAPRLGVALVSLGRTLVAHGRADEALPLLQRGHALVMNAFPPGDWRVAEARLGLGVALRAHGQEAAAREHLRTATDALDRVRKQHPRLAAQAAAAVGGAR